LTESRDDHVVLRRSGDVCSVIKLFPDNREEVVQDGMTLIEAEILCAMKIDDLPRGAAVAGELPLEEPGPKRPRQLRFKF
jgi:hypothetical protein